MVFLTNRSSSIIIIIHDAPGASDTDKKTAQKSGNRGEMQYDVNAQAERLGLPSKVGLQGFRKRKRRRIQQKKEKLKLDLNTLFTWNIKGEKCTS